VYLFLRKPEQGVTTKKIKFPLAGTYHTHQTMNLFFLDVDPKKSAEYHCDKHVVKMILELTQMLYTAHHLNGTPDQSYLDKYGYRAISNPKHPTSVWVRVSLENYKYTVNVGLLLSKEYTYRYNRVHSCESHLVWLEKMLPVSFPYIHKFNNVQEHFIYYQGSKNPVVLSYTSGFELLGLTPIPLAMPDKYKLDNDTIKSYRCYYVNDKKPFAKWTKRPVPDWFYFSTIEKYF
jgi:hypothetical protein